MKLHVQDDVIDVHLNNLKLGSFSSQGQSIARGGYLGISLDLIIYDRALYG